MLTTTNQNLERFNIGLQKSFDIDVMEELFYVLQDQMILKCNYEAVLDTNGISKDRIEAKINCTRHNIYRIINRIIKNGGNEQLNNLALCFLNEEFRRYDRVKLPRNSYRKRRMNSYLKDQRDRIIVIKQMISKLKADARIF